ncbi:hypothetical protein V6N12_007486 [Hibiscus sabdariffa]|uniref:Uncharacterized protein n=1 Tax=Hibiscus sabdariffa TaxID=183260 RepID=A0ABR2F1Z4_9ROSI
MWKACFVRALLGREVSHFDRLRDLIREATSLLLERPYIFFADDDSIPFVVIESAVEFNHLISNHSRDGRESQALVLKLLPPSIVVADGISVCKQPPLMAIQVTIFSNVSFSIGITFLFTLSLTTKLLPTSPNHGLPFVEQNGELSTDINATPIYNLQVTYTISQYKVSTLKNWITRNNGKKKKPIRLSTFEVTCAYIWVCLIKLKEAKISEIIANEDNDDDDDVIQHFIFHVECRNRLRVPQGYFGNCLQPCITAAKRNEQLAENGVIMAANAIGETVMELEKEVMKEAETWVSRLWGILKNSKHFVS